MTTPDLSQRPNVVVWAYRCWLASGALLVLLGVGYVVLAIVSSGPTLAPVGIGVLIAVVGAAFGLMGTKAHAGEVQWRSSLAALTLVTVVMLLIISFLVTVFAFSLLAAIVGLFGSLMAYRPEADAWYNGGEEVAPGKSGAKGAGEKGARAKGAGTQSSGTKSSGANTSGTKGARVTKSGARKFAPPKAPGKTGDTGKSTNS